MFVRMMRLNNIIPLIFARLFYENYYNRLHIWLRVRLPICFSLHEIILIKKKIRVVISDGVFTIKVRP